MPSGSQDKRVVTAPAAPRTLAAVADSVIRTPPLERTHWGVLVVDAETGRELYRHDAHRHYVPASNTKLVVTAVALGTFGPDYRYRTEIRALNVRADSADALVVHATGDPTMSARFHETPLAAVDSVARAIAASGLRNVGSLIIDAGAFDDVRINGSWEIGDLPWYYAPPAGAFGIEEGTFRLVVGARASHRVPIRQCSAARRFVGEAPRRLARPPVVTGPVSTGRTPVATVAGAMADEPPTDDQTNDRADVPNDATPAGDDHVDELPDDLDAAGFVGPYVFPNNNRRRVPGYLYLATAAACVAVWALVDDSPYVNDGFLFAAVLLGRLAAAPFTISTDAILSGEIPSPSRSSRLLTSTPSTEYSATVGFSARNSPRSLSALMESRISPRCRTTRVSDSIVPLRSSTRVSAVTTLPGTCMTRTCESASARLRSATISITGTSRSASAAAAARPTRPPPMMITGASDTL